MTNTLKKRRNLEKKPTQEKCQTHSAQFHPAIPSATVIGPPDAAVINDTLLPIIPSSPTPRFNLCGSCIAASGALSNEKAKSELESSDAIGAVGTGALRSPLRLGTC